MFLITLTSDGQGNAMAHVSHVRPERRNGDTTVWTARLTIPLLGGVTARKALSDALRQLADELEAEAAL